jgi:hypothetical protein
MKLASLLVGLFAASAVAFTATPAHASHLKVDGTVKVTSWTPNVTCTWTDATISADPTNTLTIDHNTINATITCTGGIQLTVTSDPLVTFSGGGATLSQTDVAITTPNCNYHVNDPTLSQVPAPPPYKYTGSATATEKNPKRLICPDNVTMDEVTLDFN